MVNNGSGHYRPSANDSLQYVKNVLIADGFEVAADAELQHVRLPFVPFDDFDVQIAPQTIVTVDVKGPLK